MTTYSITPSIWNDPGYWSTILESTSRHLLDLSALPASFQVTMVSGTGNLSITDGMSTFVVGDASASGTLDAQLGGTTEFEQFSITGSAGDDTMTGSGGAEGFDGGDGNDVFYGER